MAPEQLLELPTGASASEATAKLGLMPPSGSKKPEMNRSIVHFSCCRYSPQNDMLACTMPISDRYRMYGISTEWCSW